MSDINLGREYLAEFQMEVPATRHCLERIPESVWNFKPHEKSMNMGYLALLVGEIPRWIAAIINEGVIDFASYKHNEPKTSGELISQFEENVKQAEAALEKVNNEELEKTFELRNGDTVLMSGSRKNNIISTINHWTHHRGQLTVYMRLNDIPVPSIYGPSADDKSFAGQIK